MSIVAILALVAGMAAVAFIAWIFIVGLANRYVDDWRDDREEARQAEHEPPHERS